MSNLRDKYTDEEWDILEESLIGRKHPYDKEVKDEIVENVIDKFSERSRIGIAKYKTTLQENNLSVYEWLNHLQEELMDATLYIEKLKTKVK